MSTALDTDLLTTEDVARMLKVSPVTVSRWIKEGRLPACRVGQRGVRIRRADLAAILTPITPAARTSEPIDRELVDVHGQPVRPLTDAEVEQTLAWIEEARKLRKRQQAESGGRVLPSSADLIREMRDERSAEL